MENPEFIKNVAPPPVEQPSASEVTEAVVEQDAEKALDTVNKEAEQAIAQADAAVAGMAVAIGVSPERAASIFSARGFQERVRTIKEKIRTLAERTKAKLFALFSTQLGSKNVEDSEDLSNPRAQAVGERVASSLERFKGQRAESGALWPKEALVTDGNHIENQQIDLLYAPSGDLHVSFKLTEHQREALKRKISDLGSELSKKEGEEKKGFVRRKIAALRGSVKPVPRGFQSGEIIYEGAKPEDGGYSDKFHIKGYKRNVGDETLYVANSPYRSALGLVDITIPAARMASITPEALHREVSRILREELGISDGLARPTPEDEATYKKARYKWLHKTDTVPDGTVERLQREEVAPGYHTFVEEGKHKEYMAEGSYAVYHKIYEADALPKIIRAGGLLSTHERYRRGLLVSGMSSSSDMESGGADSVFTRTVTPQGLEANGSLDNNPAETYVVFDPKIFDRTDWYAYSGDRYGRTDPDTFKDRLSPEELLALQRKSNYSSNEQMFRSGISTKNIRAIATRYESAAVRVYEMLVKNGITEIDGRPIENLIVVAPTFKDALALSEGKELEGQIELRRLFEEKKKELEQAAATPAAEAS